MQKTKQKNMADTARQRCNVYGLLAIAYREEPTSGFLGQIKDPEFQRALSNAGVKIDDEFFKQSEEKLLEDLAVEYARLFLGPARHISPHESVHHERDDGDWGMLWGKDTVLVKKFIESAGFEYKTDYKGLPDSISAELEFMQQVTRGETQAWDEDDYEGALYCLKIGKKFIDEHLAKWIPIFCDKVISKAELSLYREMAKLTKGFIELEEKEINNYLSEAQKIKPH